MALNKSTGNMYSWITHTWNPIKNCHYDCDYCYVRHAVRFKSYDPTCRFDEKELKTNLGKGKIIFVGSMADMWGSWVPTKWIGKVVNRCYDFPENIYIFQSKNPARFEEWFMGTEPMASGRILGTTIETDDYPKDFHTNAPSIMERLQAMERLRQVGERIFITIEPVMEFDLHNLLIMIKWVNPEFVTIGADSKNHNLREPSWNKVQSLISELKWNFVDIRQKKNLERLRK